MPVTATEPLFGKTLAKDEIPEPIDLAGPPADASEPSDKDVSAAEVETKTDLASVPTPPTPGRQPRIGDIVLFMMKNSFDKKLKPVPATVMDKMPSVDPTAEPTWLLNVQTLGNRPFAVRDAKYYGTDFRDCCFCLVDEWR